MNAYLQITQAVLSKSRQPMSAREILEAAYRLQLVPDHLFGKTQYKTLHARLCEDILRNRRTSAFARTAPGRFSLRSRLGTEAEGREAYVAPQRSYQLKHFDVFCANRSKLDSAIGKPRTLVDFAAVARHFDRQVPLRRAEKDQDLTHLRLLVTIRSHDRLLTLAALEGATFGGGRSLGFFGFIRGTDADLFSAEPYGVDVAARRTIAEQTNAPPIRFNDLTERATDGALRCLRISNEANDRHALVLFVEYKCNRPDELIEYIPASRSPRWTRVPSEINDVGSLEPISRSFVELSAASG
ncbi:hypothetical protein E0H68_03365 [Rhizobium leguminosarum bv. viciae]|uniref:HTH domain-containing protein n=1 Tax=Rhizobium leguminosarum TaxID=384 RepID=UPI00103B2334|nr:hypothetical protein E0H68_03365 [Rhizobium leguminosarum bv. viciae]